MKWTTTISCAPPMPSPAFFDNVFVPKLIALRWIGISTGFDRIVEEHIENTSSLSVYEDFLWRHLHQEILTDNQLCRSHQNLLRLVIVRYFRHIREFGVPIAFFTHMLHIARSVAAALGCRCSRSIAPFSAVVYDGNGSDISDVSSRCSIDDCRGVTEVPKNAMQSLVGSES
ncbi:hypothetical protein NECAME_11787 [Necator americanus]|uniref:Uncharacterized protein n=1 Tax=Necator americanus TaxID=51031 RepID=W2T551_NECAM|nr:hypothetical protein NECAME_11787 [Necator americanus]ETN76281.1 hypothetical protein NECAME_11787 [Necator americanus]